MPIPLRRPRPTCPPGLFNGVYMVSSDSCMYAESMVLGLAARKVTRAGDPPRRDLVSAAGWRGQPCAGQGPAELS